MQANIVAVGYKNIPLPTPTPHGCYIDKSDAEGRDLPVCATKHMTTSDALTECGLLCKAYAYFALENGHECRCGDAFGKYGPATTPSADCNMPCTQDPGVTCGGFYFENVYSHTRAAPSR